MTRRKPVRPGSTEDRVLNAMIMLWLRDSPKGQSLMEKLGVPLDEATTSMREAVDADLLHIYMGEDQPNGTFSVDIDFPANGRPAPPPPARRAGALPGLPGGDPLRSPSRA